MEQSEAPHLFPALEMHILATGRTASAIFKNSLGRVRYYGDRLDWVRHYTLLSFLCKLLRFGRQMCRSSHLVATQDKPQSQFPFLLNLLPAYPDGPPLPSVSSSLLCLGPVLGFTKEDFLSLWTNTRPYFSSSFIYAILPLKFSIPVKSIDLQTPELVLYFFCFSLSTYIFMKFPLTHTM